MNICLKGIMDMKSTSGVLLLWRMYPAYRNFQLSLILTGLANWSSYLAIIVLLEKITTSGTQLGVLWAISGIAPLCLGALTGVWVDRSLTPKNLVIIEVLRGCLLGSYLVIPLEVSWTSWLIFFGVQFIYGILTSFVSASRQAIMPTLVRKEDLHIAGSFQISIYNVVRFVGASLGGVLLAWSGMEICWMLSSGSFFLSAWLIGATKIEIISKRTEQRNIFLDWKEGWKVARQNGWIVLILSSGVVFGMIIGSFNLTIQAYNREVYGLSEYGLSLLYLVEGITSTWVTLWIANRNIQLSSAISYGYFHLAIGLSWIFFGFSVQIWQGMFLLMIFACSGAFIGTFERNVLYSQVERTFLGRIFGLWFTISQLSIQLGVLLTGMIRDQLGLSYVCGIIGAIYLLYTGVFLERVKRWEQEGIKV